jgi:hypothetical protein
MKKNTVKTNWGSAMSWTILVAAITCTIFAAMLMGTLYLGGVFDPDTGATVVSKSVSMHVDTLTTEVKALREHSEKIEKYLERWTPLKCRRELGIKEKWVIPGYGIPEIVPNSYIQMGSDFICE